MGLDGQQELAALLSRVATRDRSAFQLLYQNTSAKLFASVCRILSDRSAAEDAMQEAYLKIWHRADNFDAGRGSPIAWMTTIARHAAIDASRRGAARVAAVSDELSPEVLDRLADPSTAAAPAPHARLLACLEGLDADRRSMVLLAYCVGWSREELSRRFDRPVSTVKTIVRRSLAALKECLGGGD